MEEREFKNIVGNFLADKGFEKKRNFFYKRDNNIVYVIGLQKSKYSNGFYLNVGYLIKELHPNDEYPKDVDGDVRIRFSWILPFSKKETDIFEIEGLSADQSNIIEEFVSNNVERLINSVQYNGLGWLLEKDPTLLHQTTLKAKEYLQLE